MEKTTALNRVNPVLPKAPKAINANLMTTQELHAKLQKGYDDIEAGNVQSAAEAFAKLREKH